MLSDSAIDIVNHACLEAGAITSEIFSLSEELIALHAPQLLPHARSLFKNGARTCFFECFSAFWFCKSSVSDYTKLRLSAAKLSSAIAISSLDHYVDCKAPNIPYLQSLEFASGCWDREVSIYYPKAKLWGPLVAGWIRPNHGIKGITKPELIPLLKNPFYPSVFLTYLSDNKLSRLIGNKFTGALGILDDAADLAEDFLAGNPNMGVAQIRGGVEQSNQSLHQLRNDMLLQELPNKMVDLARLQLRECLVLSADDSLALFRTCVEAIIDSLDNYAELCVARLIIG